MASRAPANIVIIKNTHIHQQTNIQHRIVYTPRGCRHEREVKSFNRQPTVSTLNQCKPLATCRKLEGVIHGHRELREATDVFDGRNNGVVSPGGDGSPDAPSSRSEEEFEATSFAVDG